MQHYVKTLVLSLVIFLVNLALWPLITAFLKIQEMRVPYFLAGTVLTTAGVLLFQRAIGGGSIKAMLYGAVLGLTSTFLAIQFSKLFDRNGPASAFRSVGEYSLLDMLAVDFVVSLLLGGWVVGILAAVTVSRMDKQVTASDR